jgi:hypothetical protein
MDEKQLRTLGDAELAQITGGVSITLTLDKAGASLTGPLGQVSIPSPFAVAGRIAGGLLGATGDALNKAGDAFTTAGHLFDLG